MHMKRSAQARHGLDMYSQFTCTCSYSAGTALARICKYVHVHEMHFERIVKV